MSDRLLDGTTDWHNWMRDTMKIDPNDKRAIEIVWACIVRCQSDFEKGGGNMDVLKELERLKASHYYCEDQWYSCPLAVGGCIDDRKPKDECDCGAEDQHKRVDALIEYLSNNGFKPIRK